MKRRHNFLLVYRGGATVKIRAAECTVKKSGDVITNVKFDNVSNWASFTVTDLVAVVRQ